jgi:hypothetical protein
MYEMEGPYPVSQRWPTDCSASLLCPTSHQTRIPRRVSPVSRLCPPPGLPPDRPPFSVVREVLLPRPAAAQGVSASNLKIFRSSTTHPQDTRGYPPRSLLVHEFIHSGAHRQLARRTSTIDGVTAGLDRRRPGLRQEEVSRVAQSYGHKMFIGTQLAWRFGTMATGLPDS